ncbi:hypothetical protein AALB47_13035 [Lachnospiraceae bacterium 54-11]
MELLFILAPGMTGVSAHYCVWTWKGCSFPKVENSFDGRLVRRRQEEFPATDKADRENHGIGMVVNGRGFILSVMMKNERREEDGFRSGR